MNLNKKTKTQLNYMLRNLELTPYMRSKVIEVLDESD